MSEDAWNTAGRGVVWMRYPWGGSFALRTARPDNPSHSGPRHRPRDSAVGDRRTTPSSASPVETGNHGYRTSRRARGPVELASSPATSDEDRHPRPAKAQQAEPCPEDQVYEAANPLREQAKRCIGVCSVVLTEFDTETAGLKEYVDQDYAACIWKMKLKRLGEKSKDKDKNVELQLMSLVGCMHRMAVAAYLLLRQLAAEDGDGHDPRLAVLTQIMEHSTVIKTLSAAAGSSNTQCKHLVEKLRGLVGLLETKEGDKPFAIFRFGQTELQAHNNGPERHAQQQQQTDQQHKDARQGKNKESIKKNQHGENGGCKKTQKPSENDERPDNGPTVEIRQDAEEGHPPSNELTEEALTGST